MRKLVTASKLSSQKIFYILIFKNEKLALNQDN